MSKELKGKHPNNMIIIEDFIPRYNEPVVKVSELLEWIEAERKFINDNYHKDDKVRELGILIELKRKFCKEAE